MTPNIQSALLQSYSDGSFGLDYEKPNTSFAPVTDEAWAKVSFINSIPIVGTQGSSGDDYFKGSFQVDLMYPLNKGMEVQNAKIESLRTYYEIGRSFTYSGQIITIESCSSVPIGESGGWYKVSVRIDYNAFISRA